MRRILGLSSLTLGLVIGVGIFGLNPIASARNEQFRTPARQYGSAYSVKIKLVRGEFSWVVPVWVKPDQKKSTFDLSLMSSMGWTEHNLVFDEVSLSGEVIEQNKFGQAKSDWAYFPDFAKTCCVGILGQDILRDFEIRFDPRPPTHLEWKRISAAGFPNSSKSKIPDLSLQSLFNLRGTSFKQRDLTSIPFTLNLATASLTFDDQIKAPEALRTVPIFQYDIVPPVRNIQVLSIARDLAKSAHQAGLKAGMTITRLDADLVGKIDRIELDQILHGKRKEKITFTFKNQKEITFDFKKNEFIAIATPVGPVPRRTR